MNLTLEIEQEEDGRWLAELPGVLAYGASSDEAKAEVLARHILAEQLERGESKPVSIQVMLAA